MNPYRTFVTQTAQLMADARKSPLGQFPFPERPKPAAAAPKALIFSPHPDDEVIVGGLALRLLREAGMNVINVAVTQGSNKARQPERWQELVNCCKYVGFGLLQTAPNGLEGVNLKTRNQNPAAWSASVARIAQILADQTPQVIFFPHQEDWNSSHVGTHYLVVDALRKLGGDFTCIAIETEFWGAMAAPNLLVESSEQDLEDLLTALTFHVGEVQRNPYHLRMPAWMIDNVRRGAELVGGQGGAAPEFTFGTLYRLQRWTQGAFSSAYERGRFLSQDESAAKLLQGIA